MPEVPEIGVEKLREVVAEEVEREEEQSTHLLRKVAMTTALFAGLAAIVSLQSGSAVNEALVLKAEATRTQAQASDEWAYYQAKGLKAAIARSAQTSWSAAGKDPPPNFAQEETKSLQDQQESQLRARALEQKRDDQSVEADRLLARDRLLSEAVALLQVCIVLGAVAALAKQKLAWFGSIVMGVLGIVFFIRAYL